MVPGFSQQAWRNPADRHRHRDSPFLVHRVASGVGPHVYGLPAAPPSSLYALYESGPVLLSMCAFFRVGPAAKFLTRTLSPSANCLSFFVLSCCIFCDNCWVCTRCLMSRRMRSSRIRQRRLNSNSAGVTPVVVCGVDLYANKNRLSLVCTLPGDRSSFFSPS